MALPNRHFRIAFSGYQVKDGVKNGFEYLDIVALFNFLVRGMKFSYDYVLFDDNGEQLPNGTWTGIFGLLNRSEVDFVPAALMLSEEEWDAAAYNYPYANDELVFLVRKPEYSPETMALFQTLSSNVWLSLLACIIFVTLACFVAMKHRCTLEDILLHVLAIGLNQEGNLIPRRAGEVLMLSTWTVAMAVFTFCFKSVLLSFLTFPPLGGVRTVPELAAAIRAGQYIACTHDRNDFARYLERSPNEDLRVIGDSMLKNSRCSMNSVMHQSTKYPMKVAVYRKSFVSFAEGKLFYLSKDNMGSLNFATAVRKDFCCKDEMDMLVHRFLAAGISQKIDGFRNYLYDLASDDPVFADDDKKTRKITMRDISGAFILLVAGHCLSLCVLIIECCVKRRERRRSSTRST